MKIRRRGGVATEYVPERNNQLRTDFISVITFYYIVRINVSSFSTKEFDATSKIQVSRVSMYFHTLIPGCQHTFQIVSLNPEQNFSQQNSHPMSECTGHTT